MQCYASIGVLFKFKKKKKKNENTAKGLIMLGNEKKNKPWKTYVHASHIGCIQDLTRTYVCENVNNLL